MLIDILTGCKAEFMLRHGRGEGVMSTCLLLGHYEDYSVEECMKAASRQRANVFNIQNKFCYVRLCSSEDLKLKKVSDGWDVYVSKGIRYYTL